MRMKSRRAVVSPVLASWVAAMLILTTPTVPVAVGAEVVKPHAKPARKHANKSGPGRPASSRSTLANSLGKPSARSAGLNWAGFAREGKPGTALRNVQGTLQRTATGWQVENPWGRVTLIDHAGSALDALNGAFVSVSGYWVKSTTPGSRLAFSAVELLSTDAQSYAGIIRQEMSDPAIPRPPEPPRRRDITTAGANPGQVGSWSPVQELGSYALHASLRPDGKVLFWEDTKVTDATDPQKNTVVWDPLSNAAESVANVTLDGGQGWCSAHTLLSDGSVMAVTGTVTTPDPATYLFSPQTNTWNKLPLLKFGRYYPSATTLADGRVLVAGGDFIAPGLDLPANPYPEIYAAGAWRTFAQGLSTVPTETEGRFFYGGFFPWIQQAPNGTVFYAGPQNSLRSLLPNTGMVTTVGQRGDGESRDYGSYATYDIGKALIAGGGNSLKTAYTIDYNGSAPVSQATGNMNFGRRHLHATLLADGKVFVSGGHSGGGKLQANAAAAVFPTELWDPQTGQWTVTASLSRRREYHTSALLLPDARVVHAGGDCGACSKEPNLEIFSPPYLFNADGSDAQRPTLGDPPARLAYQRSFTVDFANAASISKVNLLKLGQSTHSTNFDQRLVPLQFTAASNTLTVTGPDNANIAPPGYYMLFVLNERGVPAVAPIVKVGLTVGQITNTIDTGKTYSISNKANGMCLSVTGTALASAVVQAACNASAMQKFTFTATSPGYYRIVSAASGRVLDIPGADTNKGDGIRIQIYDSQDSALDQQWHFENATAGFVRITNRNSARNIDVPGNNNNRREGAPLDLYFNQAESTDQQWQLHPLSGG